MPRLRAEMAAATHGSRTEPERTVRAFAHVIRIIADRAAPWWQIYRDAAASDPEIAQDWAALTALRRGTTAALLQDLTGEHPTLVDTERVSDRHRLDHREP